MVQLATNNAYALIPGAVSSTATSVTIETGRGAVFPILGTGDYFYTTFVDVVGNYEIVQVTARTGDILTIVRAQQGTLAIPFPANSRVELRVTAANIVSSGGGGGGGDAADITYTPVDLNNWASDTDPGQVDDALDQLASRVKESIIVVCSDETTAITAGTSKVTFRMPYNLILDDIRASLTTPQTSGNIFTVDINENSVSILSTKLTIDNGELTSVTAATPRVLSDYGLAEEYEVTIDVDQVGDGTAKGLKIILNGIRG